MNYIVFFWAAMTLKNAADASSENVDAASTAVAAVAANAAAHKIP